MLLESAFNVLSFVAGGFAKSNIVAVEGLTAFTYTVLAKLGFAVCGITALKEFG
jgi:hypothetical protein